MPSTPPAPSALAPRRWLALDVIMLCFVGATIVVVLFEREMLPHWVGLALAHVALLGLYAALRVGATRRSAVFGVYIVSLFLFVFAVFTGMGFILRQVRADAAIDGELSALDVRWFGSDPTLWFTPYLNRWTTLVLETCYSTYFLIFIVVAVLVLGRKQRLRFLSYAATIIGCFFTSYVFYYLMPALGPRGYVPYAEPVPFGPVGRWMYDAIDTLDNVKYNAFPSGHTAISLICLAILWREDRRLGWIFTPLVAGLIVATVALRYHYLVDVVAGAVLGVFGAVVVMPLILRFDGRGEARGPAAFRPGAPTAAGAAR